MTKGKKKWIALAAVLLLFAAMPAVNCSAEENEYSIAFSGSSAETDCPSVSVEQSAVTITKAGTYRVTGTANNGRILVDASDEDKVKLILDNAEISCADTPAIYVLNAKKLVLSSAAGTVNTICSTGESPAGETADAAVFSHDDLTLNGDGTIRILAENMHGVVSKDKLKVKSGILEISSGKKGLYGKDCVTIEGGSLVIASEDDAIHSNKEILMQGGELTVTTGDDGMHADDFLSIEGGTLRIDECYEGLEALSVHISGGDITVNASDDGINAAGGKDSSNTFGRFGGDPFQAEEGAEICISGGNILIAAEGDGIDSNGSLRMSGGTVYISGPTFSANGALDYASTAEISGGVIVAAGAAGMAAGFDSSSAQASILYCFPSQVAAGAAVTLIKASGDVLASYTPEKSFSSVAVSAPGLESSGTYRLVVGADEYTIEMNGTAFSNSGPGFGQGFGPGFGPGMGMPPQFSGGFGGRMDSPGGRPEMQEAPPEGRSEMQGKPSEGMPPQGAGAGSGALQPPPESGDRPDDRKPPQGWQPA